jgi:hypothetical protein
MTLREFEASLLYQHLVQRGVVIWPDKEGKLCIGSGVDEDDMVAVRDYMPELLNLTTMLRESLVGQMH